METTLTQYLDPIGYDPTESELNFGLSDMSQGLFASFSGNLRGPRCQYAHTLPSSFSLPNCECQPDSSNMVSRRITDPCYWTPALPYLYDLDLACICADKTNQTLEHTIGFRRWEMDGRNLLLERRRYVLRGGGDTAESDIDLQAAHDAEIAVMARNPSESFLQEASERGVMVIADLRCVETELTPRLLQLAWQPSVGLVVLPENPKAGFYVPPAVKIGQWVKVGPELTPEVIAPWTKVILVELHETLPLPTWLANINIPVIAIRQGEPAVSPVAIRQACDRLQADLAPDFDLAGYFIAS